MDWQKRIVSNADICHGKPCIKGTRIMVSVILDNLSEGISYDEIMKEFPPITRDDLLAVLNYAAELARDQFMIPMD